MDTTRRRLARLPFGIGAWCLGGTWLSACGGSGQPDSHHAEAGNGETVAPPTAAELAATAATTPTGFVSVKDAPYNAKGNGVDDDTVAIQAAINAAEKVYLPPGTYRVRSLRLRDMTQLSGAGSGSILQQTGDLAVLLAESSSPTTSVGKITLQKLQLRGEVASKPFNEHVHLVRAHGVSELLITDCVFRGFRGDGLYLSGMDTASQLPRHNTGVTVRQCHFDGLNNNNRNAITVVDGDLVRIENNQFYNCTRSDMPGPVDIEPNDFPFHVIRDITVTRNSFKNVGGNVAAVGVVLAGHQYTTEPSGFEISYNTVDTCPAYAFAFFNAPAGGVTSATAGHRVRIGNNTVVNTKSSFWLTGVKGAAVEFNHFTDRSGSYIGYVQADQRCLDVKVTGNEFLRCGSVDRIGMQVFTVDGLSVEGNRFIDCGSGLAGSCAVDFKWGSSTSVRIIGNNFSAPTGMTAMAIQREANHTLAPVTNKFISNVLNGLPHRFLSV